MLLFEGVEIGGGFEVDFGMTIKEAIGFSPAAIGRLMRLVFANKDDRGTVRNAVAGALKDDVEDVRAGDRALAFGEVRDNLVKVGGEPLLVVLGVHHER